MDGIRMNRSMDQWVALVKILKKIRLLHVVNNIGRRWSLTNF
jgi:hypothetical protein